MALGLVSEPGLCQTLHYVEPGGATCPAVVAPGTAAPKRVHLGAAVPGRIHVRCGFDQGSYTVTLNTTDPGASFSPKTFVVNFGRIVSSGAFTVRFSTEGIHTVSASITANMGSPAVQGQFVGAANRFSVVPP